MNTDDKQFLPATVLTAIGIVYGDIGTSPLYTIKECLCGQFHFSIDHDSVFGFLSLIFWLLILVVSIKYLSFVMKTDNAGEGGIFTLMSLSVRNTSKKITSILIIIGLIGGSFFYGEAVITPAISVMSAIEGLEMITPQLNIWIVPLSIIILTLLFIVQKHGTSIIAKLFAPIMLIWFVTLAILGLRSIIANPYILSAVNPIWLIHFFMKYKTNSYIALGAAVLSITGAEALYADMGHCGKLPIRVAWFMIVLPSLVLNYFGQGALLIAHHEVIKNPFFLLAPHWALAPIIVIATLATIIASQAVISGVFSLTYQAIHLGYLLPMRIVHTSEMKFGQIYIPCINWLLYCAVVMIIVNFEDSSNLAAAYGIAVTGTMILTSVLATIVAYYNWHWNKMYVITILIICLCIDIPLFLSNLDKIISGGWLPLTISLIMFIVMTTWKNERFLLLHRMNKYGYSVEVMIALLEQSPPIRVPGTAVYMSRVLNIMPLALIHNLKHNKILHERVILLTLRTEDTPYVHNIYRVQVEHLSSIFWRVIARYGWRETPNMEDIFYLCNLKGLNCQIMEMSFFMSHEFLIIGQRSWYLRQRGKLYLILQRNALRMPDQFKIPPKHVIELGIQIEI